MLIRSGWVVLAVTIIVWLASTWGYAFVTFVFGWWAAFVLFGGLRHGIIIHGVRNLLSGFGEEQPPRLEDGARESVP